MTSAGLATDSSADPAPISAQALSLHPDRFFDSDPAIRRAARDIHAATCALPLICPHGHVDPWLLTSNAPFPEPTALLITPDHYILRMLCSQGVSMDSMGVPTIDGSPVEQNPRIIWQRFAAHFHLFLGTPTGVWFNHTLHELFGVREKLTATSSARIYDQIAERLASPEFLPRALFERFRIEVLATTDAAGDTLEPHRLIRDSGWSGRVVPTFRPDAVFRIASAQWRIALAALETQHGSAIPSFADFLGALASRRAYFASLGATATDHAVVTPFTQRLDRAQLDRLFDAALAGTATASDQRAFEAHMLIEMARMSTEDGLVM